MEENKANNIEPSTTPHIPSGIPHAVPITSEENILKNRDISVIIPVFNTAPYLKECLNSLLAQSHRNLEIICINDASTDNSLAILKEYAQKDARIRVYSFDKNVNAASSRNFALTKAQGEYISFIDSDDWISTNFYENLYKEAKSGDYDLVKSAIYSAFTDGTLEFISDNSKIAHYLEQNKFLGSVYTYFHCIIYRNAFLKNINAEFPKMRHGEDVVFLLNVLIHNPRCSFVQGTFYYYRQHQNSGSRKFSKNTALYYLTSFEMQSNLLNDSEISHAGYMEYYYEHIYTPLLEYYKDVILVNVSKQELLFYLENTCEILKQCKYLNDLIESCSYVFLKKFITDGFITESNVVPCLKEIYLEKRNFLFSYAKFWFRSKILGGRKKDHYARKYLACKHISQLEQYIKEKK